MQNTLTEIEQFNKWHDSEFQALPEYKLKIRTFLNNTVDFIVSRTNLNQKRILNNSEHGYRVNYTAELTDEQLEQKRLENIERACRHARQKVHFLVRQLGADHMLTLTTRELITDTKLFDVIFTRFIRLVRTKYLTPYGLQTSLHPNNWAFVGVREFQERGALHMHIACVGRQNIAFLRACWYVALGGHYADSFEQARGQVDVQYSQKRFSGQSETHKTFKLVQYLCKYISKSFEENTELGKARYKASRGIPAPIVNKQYLPVYFSSGNESFIKAMEASLRIAEFLGVENQELWNRGLDIFILRGSIS